MAWFKRVMFILSIMGTSFAKSPPGWLQKGQIPYAGGIKDIIELPWDTTTVIAVGFGNNYGRIWKSEDKGGTWSQKLYVSNSFFEDVDVDTSRYLLWAIGSAGLYYSLNSGDNWFFINYPDDIDSIGSGWQVIVINHYVYYGGVGSSNSIKLYRLNTTSSDPSQWEWEFVATLDGCNNIDEFIYKDDKLYVFAEKSTYDSVRVYEVSLDAPASSISVKSTLPITGIWDVKIHNDSAYVAADSSLDIARVYSSYDMAAWNIIGEWSNKRARALDFINDTLIVGFYDSDTLYIYKKSPSGWQETFTPEHANRLFCIERIGNTLWTGTYPYGDIFEAIWQVGSGGAYVYGPTWVNGAEVHNDTIYFTTNYTYGEVYRIVDDTSVSVWQNFGDASEAYDIIWLGDTVFVSVNSGNLIKRSNDGGNTWEYTFKPENANAVYTFYVKSDSTLMIGTGPYGDVFVSNYLYDVGGKYVYGPTWVNDAVVHNDTIYFATNYNYGELYRMVDTSDVGIWKVFSDVSSAYAIKWWGDTILVSVDSNNLIKRSSDGGNTWEYTFKPENANAVYTFYVKSDSTLMIGTGPYGDVFTSNYLYDVGGKYINGPTWVYDAKFCGNKLYIGTNYDYGEIWVSNDTGQTWTNMIDASWPWSKVYTIVPIGDTLYIGTNYNGNVYKSTDGGQNWTETGDLTNATDVYTLYLSKHAEPNKLFAGTGPYGDVFLTDTTILHPPVMVNEPEYTQGDSNTVYCHIYGSNEYQFICALDSSFNNIFASSPWINDTFYTFHNLENGVTYYYHVFGKICEQVVGPSNYTWSTQANFAPEFFDEYPPDSSWINTSTPLISVHVRDTISSIDSTSISMTIDGVNVNPVYNDSMIFFQVTDPFSDGPHLIMVSATNNMGNVGNYSWTIFVDTHTPEVPQLNSPENNAIINDTIVEFIWSQVLKHKNRVFSNRISLGPVVYSKNDTLAPVRYIIEIGNNNFDSLSIVDTLDSTRYVTSFIDGVYYWRVKAYDLAGNESRWSSARQFMVDVTPPEPVSLVNPVNNAMLNTSNITLDWNDGSDATSGISGYWIEVSIDSIFAGVDSHYVSISETTMTFNDTTYFWRVKAVDAAGNEGAWSNIWKFTVDTHAPAIPELISPIEGIWLRDSLVEFEWSPVSIKDFILKYGGNYLNELKASPVRYVVMIDENVVDTVDSNYYATVMGEGRHTWRVMAFDLSGNESGWSPVDSFGVDVTPPEPVNLISPADSAMLNTSRISFDWSDGVDSTSGVAGYWIEVSMNESFTGVESSFVSVSETTMVLSDTTWYWRVKAVDNAGNQGDWSEVWQFTVDTEPPEAPVLMFPIGNVWLDNDTITFVWSKVTLKTPKDEKSTPVMYMLEVDGNAVDTAITDTTYTFVVEEGNHTWRVKAYDFAGNISQWSDMGQFGVDTSAPVIDSLTTIMDTVRSVGPWVIDTWVEDAYSGIDNVQLIYQIDTGWDTVAMADSGNGRWVGEIPAITDSLAHDIMYYVEVTDSVGNSSVSDTISFVAIEVEEDNYWGKVELVIPSIVTKRGMEIKYNVPGNRKFVVRIYDISGREIWRENLDLTGKGTKKLNLKVREGVYFISIEGTGNVIKRRLIVIRE